eukprot:GHVL01003997.1.p1 GENE.GHVL01003997.1~~GHVL01003997.1.p1  ORF type:complete len:590 (-),score=100.95 GHVL01003997.1:617-2386(-)
MLQEWDDNYRFTNIDILKQIDDLIRDNVQDSKLNDFEEHNFYQYYRELEARKVKEAAELHENSWIKSVDETCGELHDNICDSLNYVADILHNKSQIAAKTKALHEQCSDILSIEQEAKQEAQALGRQLDYFDRLSFISTAIDSDIYSSIFSDALDSLDEGIIYMERSFNIPSAIQYLRQYQQLRSRACSHIRKVIAKSIEKTLAYLEPLIRQSTEKDHWDTSLFYIRFRTMSSQLLPLTGLLYRKADYVNEDVYWQTLEYAESLYGKARVTLVSGPLKKKFKEVLEAHEEKESIAGLATAARQMTCYIVSICKLEYDSFNYLFPPRHPQEALEHIIQSLGHIWYELIRPHVLQCECVDTLREVAECLWIDVLESHNNEDSQSVSSTLAAIIMRLYKDVHERLIFRSEAFIRDHIRGFRPTSTDTDYPGRLIQLSKLEPCVLPRQTWYPTLDRTLMCLSSVNRVLKPEVFSVIAGEAVDGCLSSLLSAAKEVEAVRGGYLDSSLFLIRHLLALREQALLFQCDVSHTDKNLDFSRISSSVWDFVTLKNTKNTVSSWIASITPTIQDSQHNTKKDVEFHLKNVNTQIAAKD